MVHGANGVERYYYIIFFFWPLVSGVGCRGDINTLALHIFHGLGEKKNPTKQTTLKTFEAQQETPHECLISTLHT